MLIDVIYALPDEQICLSLEVDETTHIEQAIQASGILQRCPEIDLKTMKVGVFSKIKPLNETLQPGDRIEIYRPLLIDPKEVRKKRAEKAKREKAKAAQALKAGA